MDEIRFTCPLPPKALSPNARCHWREKNAAKQAYAEQVWCAGYNSRCCCNGGTDWHTLNNRHFQIPWTWAAVHLVKHSTHETDQDNIIASCKTLIDCLSTKGTRPLGIFEDDKHVAITAEWKRERIRAKGRIEVTVTRREAP